MRQTVVYSGTFDPITLGHENIIARASALFDEVVVAVACAHHKTTRFSLQERTELVQRSVAVFPNVRVVHFDGLLIDTCQAEGATAVVRGIRNNTDFDYEAQMAAMNRKLSPGLDTVFLVTEPELQCISSTLVREIAKLGGDVSALVAPHVCAALQPPALQV